MIHIEYYTVVLISALVSAQVTCLSQSQNGEGQDQNNPVIIYLSYSYLCKNILG